MILLAILFSFWQVAVGTGVAGVAVPIIIHLLNRRRFKIVTWAAMRFLLAAQRQNTRRMRIEQLLLLLVRCVLVALIVFAMASVMPWAEAIWTNVWPEGSGRVSNRKQRVHHVIVLDASLSMNLSVEGKTNFDLARQLALQKIQNGRPGDGYSVLLLKDPPSWVIGEISLDSRKVVRELEGLRAGHGNAAVPTALNMVLAKLNEASGRFPTQAVYFFTDMQQSTWQALPTQTNDPRGDPEGANRDKDVLAELQQRANLVFVDVGKEEASNIAVMDVMFGAPYVTTGYPLKIGAMIHNYGNKKQDALRVELLAGKVKENASDPPMNLRVVDQQVISMPGGDKRALIFDHKFPAAGTYVVQVRVEVDGEHLDLDNSRSVVTLVKDTIPVLLVNGKQAADPYDRATEYVRLALNPFPAGSEPKYAPLRPRVIPSTQFADLGDQELASYDAIFWSDVGQFGTLDVRRLETHLRRGGGWVVSLGDRVAENIDNYNRLLHKDGQGLFPLKFDRKVVAPADHNFFFQIAQEEFEEPPLRNFTDDEDRQALLNARFKTVMQSQLPAEGKTRTIVSFRSESTALAGDKKKAAPPMPEDVPVSLPAIVEWNPPMPRAAGAVGAAGGAPARGGKRNLAYAKYRGKVLAINTSLNMDWTTWPGSPSFGAMMQEATRYAVSGRLKEQSAIVGQPLEEFFPMGTGEMDVVVNYPPSAGNVKPGQTRTQLMDEANLFRWTETDYAGIYKVSLNNQEIPFAVNVPATTSDLKGTESDFARLSGEKLREQHPGWDFQVVSDPNLAQLKETGSGDVLIEEQRAPVGPNLARYALYGVLLLIFLEVLLAWQFGHYSAGQGVTAPARVHWGWPLGALAITAVLFTFGALMVGEANWRGDFLGILPDQFRAWVERALGVPPAPPGEGSHWKPNVHGWLPYGLGNELWWAGTLTLLGGLLVIFIYRDEGPTVPLLYKLVLAVFRIFLIATTLYLLLPQFEVQITRTGWPDVVILLDNSRSMGEPDSYQEAKVFERVKKLAEGLRAKLEMELPDRLAKTKEALDAAKANAAKHVDAVAEVDLLANRVLSLERQQADLANNRWRPSRLQIAQAILNQADPDWIKTLVQHRQMKVNLYHLDVNGRAIKFSEKAGAEVADASDLRSVELSKQSTANLEADGTESRLGTALRQVIDQYRGSSLAGVIMFTDGVTTRDETIAQISEYAAQKGVPLFFVGIGDDHQIRDLKLHDLQCDDQVLVGDSIIFDCRLTGQGYKDLTVPVVLKVKHKDGKEMELSREMIKVDPQGKTKKIRLRDRPKEVGRRTYVIEVQPPKLEANEKPIPSSNLRLERTIEVIDNKLIRVLYVESIPRYEFRYVKFLLERESLDKNNRRTVELKVMLLDADNDFPAQDASAISQFPPTLEELNQFDVLLIGDIDPRHPKLGDHALKLIANFVRGEDDKGKKLPKSGGGVLFMGGALSNPHAFKDTPLADILPVEPLANRPTPEPLNRVDKFRPELTPVGRMHSIFRFSPDDAENMAIWQRLAPMYYYATNYKIKPLAEVLAVHPNEKAIQRNPNQDERHPLAVQQFVGTGRSMFFAFDETWRWRLREDEARFNHFWVQTLRYLSRGRSSKTDIRLDRQTPYRAGDPIKVTVRFPENLPGNPINDKTEVKLMVEYKRGSKEVEADTEYKTMQLAKVEGSWNSFEGQLSHAKEGKYKFRLIAPDVSKTQPDGDKPAADAVVELPPGELDRLRMNYQEMTQAAETTSGKFYSVANADQVLEDLPPGSRPILSSPSPPFTLWNQWYIYVFVLALLSCEWALRKARHLL